MTRGVGVPSTLSPAERELVAILRRGGMSVRAVARVACVHHTTVHRLAPGGQAMLPVGPLRAWYERLSPAPSEVARVLGWLDARGRPLAGRVRRDFGVGPDNGRHRQQVTVERGCQMARAIGLHPADVWPGERLE